MIILHLDLHNPIQMPGFPFMKSQPYGLLTTKYLKDNLLRIHILFLLISNRPKMILVMSPKAWKNKIIF